MLVFDESSGIPDSIWSVAAGFFTEDTPNRFWLAFSNPRRTAGIFTSASTVNGISGIQILLMRDQ